MIHALMCIVRAQNNAIVNTLILQLFRSLIPTSDYFVHGIDQSCMNHFWYCRALINTPCSCRSQNTYDIIRSHMTIGRARQKKKNVTVM